MNDIFDLFGAVADGGKSNSPIDRTDVNGFMVSTVDTMDKGPETAIVDANGAHPVERYGSVKEATIGHAMWVSRIKNGLRDVSELGYGSLVDAEKITLKSK